MEKTQNSLKQQIYEDLKRKIVTCEILPGAQLTEEILCDMLNASRTPVRDAVSRLEQEQLVTIYPKKGIYVNRISLNNVSELFEARLNLEPYAVAHYGNRIRDVEYADWLTYFENQNGNDPDVYLKDDAFHQMFIDAAGNRYITRFYRTVSEQTMRFRVLTGLGERLSAGREEHLNIVRHCLMGNWTDAAEAMRVHLGNSKISIIRYVQEQNLDAKNIFLQARAEEAEE